MNFGFNDCNVNWGPLFKNVTEEDMMNKARAANANGFIYQSKLKYGKIMIGEYPKYCESPSWLSWPLYLANYKQQSNDNEVPLRNYVKMDFGFDGCNLNWGKVLKGISLREMENYAERINAKGFAYQSTLKYGSILMGEYPKDCKSPANMSWPLYLLK